MIYFQIGFGTPIEIVCSEIGHQVSRYDGCTFGEVGDPIFYKPPPVEIDISHDATVHGWH